jgi:hypothetical protein
MASDPSFEVPVRPERRFPPSGGVEYRGEVAFHVTPRADRSVEQLDGLLVDVLADERYVRGDFFDLPAPAYLVRDREVDTSFRVVVREGRVELHVLPHTDAAALEALYGRLAAAGEVAWSVERRENPAP